MLEGWAKEDARYAIALATETQLGMTINARNLELMLRRLAAVGLAEARLYSEQLYARNQRHRAVAYPLHTGDGLRTPDPPELARVLRSVRREKGKPVTECRPSGLGHARRRYAGRRRAALRVIWLELRPLLQSG
ncbi:MAG: FAD-dependent thymidylate synthase [Desulfobacterales bacterium]|nr:FAD-dependent thymidylate synthase [Desulfobacterales bacterium]